MPSAISPVANNGSAIRGSASCGSASRAVRVALAITTYARPDALAAVLASVARQRAAPDEIIVADDGSGEPTGTLVREFAARQPVPLRHVVQPHEGFRLTRLRNLAIAASGSDYLVFVDGDMLLHPQFVADHRRLARPGYFTQGVRVHADARLAARVIADPSHWPRVSGAGLGGLRRAYLLRSRAMSSAMRRLANGLVAIKGCNQAFWRSDLERVNGFEERIVGSGPEDKERSARLVHAGVRRQTLLFGGIACHLHHPAASRASLPANLAVLAETRATRRIRAERGLDAHTRP
jgi:glycosyltransferase involved in cell wall biosynthesis